MQMDTDELFDVHAHTQTGTVHPISAVTDCPVCELG